MTLQLRNRFLLSILLVFFCGIVFAQNPTQETPATKETPQRHRRCRHHHRLN